MSSDCRIREAEGGGRRSCLALLSVEWPRKQMHRMGGEIIEVSADVINLAPRYLSQLCFFAQVRKRFDRVLGHPRFGERDDELAAEIPDVLCKIEADANDIERR